MSQTQQTRICYYNHTGLISGAEKVLFTVLGGLGSDYQPTLIAPSNKIMEKFCHDRLIDFEAVAELQARFTFNPLKLVTYLFSVVNLIWQVRSIIAESDPDLVHANSTRAGLVASLATIGMKMPVFWHIHDILPKHPLSTFIRALIICSKRNRVLAVSEATGKAFQGKLLHICPDRTPVATLHNGIAIDEDDRRLDPRSRAELCESLGVEPEDFIIGIIGQITPRKGQLELVRSFATLIASGFRPTKLLIVGSPIFNRDTEYLSQIESEIGRLGVRAQVRVLGHRSDISAILRCLDVLVLNSSSEPFSIVLLEALAHGTPVVASRVDGVSELIEDRKSGFLFSQGNEAELIRALRFLAENPSTSKTLGESGRQRVESQFTQQLFLKNLRIVYNENLMQDCLHELVVEQNA